MIECYSLTDWVDIVKKRYSPEETILNVSDNAITVLQSIGNSNVILARWCKVSKYGVVLERRQLAREVEFDRRGT